MAKPTDKERVGQDLKRIQASDRPYRDWEDEYQCDLLEAYYYGKQWQGDEMELSRRKYVINLFYAAIKRSKPSLLFQVPSYRVIPRLTRMDDKYSDVEARAKLQEDILNTFVQDPKLGFSTEAGLSILDAQFRFGMIEVGYTADYIDNPNADKPIIQEGQTLNDENGEPVLDAKFKIRGENLYLKYISAKNVRVSARNANRLTACDWVSYYEWQYIDDIRSNPRYKNTSNLAANARMKYAGARDAKSMTDTEPTKPNMLKVWKMWDLRSKTRKVFADGAEKYFFEESFDFLPLASLKFDEILGQFLPLPPTYNWAHPQNQLNDMREMRRVHRKRALPKFLRRGNAFANEEEFSKLIEEDEGITVEVQGDPLTAIAPIPYPPLDSGIFRDEATGLEDFTRVSAISGESQQVAQSETATQANLIAVMGQIVQNANRMEVALFLGEVGRIILLTIREKMALPIWIKKSIDPTSPFAPVEAQDVAKLWSQIQKQDVGDVDNDIRVDISSMSPVQQAQERQDFVGFLTLLLAPGMGALLSSSPALMRKTAGLFNIHSERDISDIAQAVQVVAMREAAAMASKAGIAVPGGGGGGGGAAPGPTPTNQAIVQQLQQQLPTETTVQ